MFAAAVCAILAVGAGSASCLEPSVWLGGGAGERELAVVVPPEHKRALDLLFVVDTAGDKRAALASAIAPLIRQLGSELGGGLSLHVGVVSSDMGAGGLVPGCSSAGDAGRMQIGALALPEPFLRDLPGADARSTNYDPALTLDQAIQAMLELPPSTCIYEQPLEAMRAALDGRHADHGGFLRPGAVLAVVFATDEDDCSALDPAFYDPELDRGRDAPGYRCFRDAARCDNTDDVIGTRHDCRARTDPEHLRGLDEYVAFLDGLVRPDRLLVAALIGDADTARIVPTDRGGRALDPEAHRCDGTDEQYPAVRLGALVETFAARETRVDYGARSARCGDRGDDALFPVGQGIRKSLGMPCFFRRLRDLDPDQSGYQADCRVVLERDGGQGEEIFACPNASHPSQSPNVPCYVIESMSATCSEFPSMQGLDVWWGWADAAHTTELSQPSDVHVVGRCLVDPREDDLPLGVTGGDIPRPR